MSEQRPTLRIALANADDYAARRDKQPTPLGVNVMQRLVVTAKMLQLQPEVQHISAKHIDKITISNKDYAAKLVALVEQTVEEDAGGDASCIARILYDMNICTWEWMRKQITRLCEERVLAPVVAEYESDSSEGMPECMDPNSQSLKTRICSTCALHPGGMCVCVCDTRTGMLCCAAHTLLG